MSREQQVTIDRCALNLALDLGLADQDLWLRHLWVACDGPDQFIEAVTNHIELPRDEVSRVWRVFDEWGWPEGLQEFDDVLDMNEPVFTDAWVTRQIELEFRIDLASL